MSGDHPHPRGDLSLRTVAMPADTNPAGDIFGGWIMSLMDLAAGVAATPKPKAVSYRRRVQPQFHSPGKSRRCHLRVHHREPRRPHLDHARCRDLGLAARPGRTGASDRRRIRSGRRR